MKLSVDLTGLWAKAREMGEHKVEFGLNTSTSTAFAIDDKLSSTAGLDVGLDDLSINSGVLSVKGRQVLLFIPDQGSQIEDVLAGRKEGNKFHIADCKTLKDMKARNRFARYRATYNVGGVFSVFGTERYSGNSIEGEAELNVCKNCLTYLNYQGYKTDRQQKAQIYNRFDIAEFLSSYSTLFKSIPKRANALDRGGYSSDWSDVSQRYRSSVNFCCEECRVNLSEHSRLLHSHHINGNKRENHPGNLQALCSDCHRKQPLHGTMYVGHRDMVLINRLRREQGLLNTQNWKEVRQVADQALDGVIRYCETKRFILPDVAYPLLDDNNQVAATLELAWPRVKKAIAINPEDIETAKQQGWRVSTPGEAMQTMNS